MSQETKFCSRCGAPLTPGASFCSNCGAPVAAAPAEPAPSMPRREYRGEKAEKTEKGEKSEKGGARGDWTGPLTGGLILVWLGISFYLAQTSVVSWTNWWTIFLPGIGVIVILQGAIRYLRYRVPGQLIGAMIGGGVLIVIGLSSYLGLSEFWPLFIIIIGLGIIASAVLARRGSPRP